MEAPTVGPERGKSLRKDHGPPGAEKLFFCYSFYMSSVFWKRNKAGSRTHKVMAVNMGERHAAVMNKTEWRWASRGGCESTWKMETLRKRGV